MPVMFSTRVIDDTQGARFEEKNRRFIHVTPVQVRGRYRKQKG